MTTFAFDFASRSETGLVRKANEDSCGDALTPFGHAFAVCDGMGGHVGGAVASRMAVECILEYLGTNRGETLQQAIGSAIEFANTQIFARAHHDASLKGMGTTCTVAIVTNDGQVFYGHVGDSRIYLFSEGRLQRVTRDHSYVQLLVDTGQIREEDAESHPNKNQILRALGIDETVKPEVAPDPLLPAAGDMLLLCSDGLSGMTSDQEMEAALKPGGGEEAVGRLMQLALDGGGKDNITATLIRFTASPHARTVFRQTRPVPVVQEPAAQVNFDTDPTLTLAPQAGRSNRKFVLIGIAGTLLLAAAAFFFWPNLQDQPVVKEGKAPQAKPAPAKDKGKAIGTDTAKPGVVPAKKPAKKPAAPAPKPGTSAPAPSGKKDSAT